VAANILGVATKVPVIANGTNQVQLDEGTVLSGVMTQDLTFSATNASGTLSQQTVHLVAGTKAAQVKERRPVVRSKTWWSSTATTSLSAAS